MIEDVRSNPDYEEKYTFEIVTEPSEEEEGYILAVNQENPVEHLSPEQIMDVFDANITNWEDLNGENQDILVFRFSDLTNYYTEEELGEEFQYVPEKINELIHKEPGIIAFFPEQ